MKTARMAMIENLRRADIFAGLSDVDLERVSEICSRVAFRPGDYGAVQGETTDRLLIVSHGKVGITMRIEVAPYTQTVTIATLTGGQVCAWSALVPPHVLSASVKCTEDTEMISLKASDLLSVFKERPSIEATVMRNLAGIVSSRLRESHFQLTRIIAEMIKRGK